MAYLKRSLLGLNYEQARKVLSVAFPKYDWKRNWNDKTELPTHFVLKINRNEDVAPAIFKSRVVAGRHLQIKDKDLICCTVSSSGLCSCSYDSHTWN